ISTYKLANGAVTAAKIGGVLATNQIPNLDASKITSGTISDQRLSPNVALLNTNQTFSGSNIFSGVAVLTNANNALAGNGVAITALNANNISSGQVPDQRLSPNVALLNGVNLFTGTNTFTGTNYFSGTNLFSGQVIATN